MITRFSAMTFGDIAAVIKPIPNVALTSEVRIAAVGLFKGQIAYTIVVVDGEGNFVEQAGPYPAHAFRFLSHCDVPEGSRLIEWLNKNTQ